MSRVYRAVIDIHAKPDRVLAILTDVERWPEWTSTMTSVRRLDPGAFRVGSRAHVRQPKVKPAVWRVTELDGRHFTWVTSGPGIRMRGGHEVEPTDAGCRATLWFELSGLLAFLAARVAGALIQEYVGIEAQGLKKRAEA